MGGKHSRRGNICSNGSSCKKSAENFNAVLPIFKSSCFMYYCLLIVLKNQHWLGFGGGERSYRCMCAEVVY